MAKKIDKDTARVAALVRKYTEATKNRTKHITPEQADIILENIAMTGSVAAACAKAGVAYRTYMYEIDTNDKFKKQVDGAKIMALAVLEEEAFRRAVFGTNEPVRYKGKKVGEIKKYSDSLLMFIMKARDSKYRNDSGGVSSLESVNVVFEEFKDGDEES